MVVEMEHLLPKIIFFDGVIGFCAETSWILLGNLLDQVGQRYLQILLYPTKYFVG